MKEKKLYYENSYLKNFKANVISIKKENDFYKVILDKTAFYPEGGGQSFDTGFIGDAEVLEVHTINDQIEHTVNKSLEKHVSYDCNINWERRFYNMQHHSAEHLVSGVANKLFNADNVGFHLGSNFVTIDYNVLLNQENINEIEILSNEAIYKNLPIEIEYYNTIPKINYRSKKEIDGVIRLVKIKNYDVCACCGTQLNFTGEIGLIKCIDFQRYKGGTRIYMICGLKALEDYNLKQQNITLISNLLSVKKEEVFLGVNNLLNEKNEIRQELIKTKLNLFKLKADTIEKTEKICLFLDNYSIEDLIKFHTFLLEKSDFIALFSLINEENENMYRYFIYSKRHDNKILAKIINNKLNGKGGGKEYICGSVNASINDIKEVILLI